MLYRDPIPKPRQALDLTMRQNKPTQPPFFPSSVESIKSSNEKRQKEFQPRRKKGGRYGSCVIRTYICRTTPRALGASRPLRRTGMGLIQCGTDLEAGTLAEKISDGSAFDGSALFTSYRKISCVISTSRPHIRPSPCLHIPRILGTSRPLIKMIRRSIY